MRTKQKLVYYKTCGAAALDELVTDIEAPHLLAATADALVHDIQELPPLSCSSPSSKDAIGLSGRVHNRPDE